MHVLHEKACLTNEIVVHTRWWHFFDATGRLSVHFRYLVAPIKRTRSSPHPRCCLHFVPPLSDRRIWHHLLLPDDMR